MAIFGILLLLIVLSFLWPVIRFFLALIFLAGVISVFTSSDSGTSATTSSTHVAGKTSEIMSYKELEDYPVSCDKKEIQLAELRNLQRKLNYAQDPDQLNDYDRAYNSRLKSTIWWFSYGCSK